jgi:hypothetical protein
MNMLVWRQDVKRSQPDNLDFLKELGGKCVCQRGRDKPGVARLGHSSGGCWAVPGSLSSEVPKFLVAHSSTDVWFPDPLFFSSWQGQGWNILLRKKEWANPIKAIKWNERETFNLLKGTKLSNIFSGTVYNLSDRIKEKDTDPCWEAVLQNFDLTTLCNLDCVTNNP